MGSLIKEATAVGIRVLAHEGMRSLSRYFLKDSKMLPVAEIFFTNLSISYIALRGARVLEFEAAFGRISFSIISAFYVTALTCAVASKHFASSRALLLGTIAWNIGMGMFFYEEKRTRRQVLASLKERETFYLWLLRTRLNCRNDGLEPNLDHRIIQDAYRYAEHVEKQLPFLSPEEQKKAKIELKGNLTDSKISHIVVYFQEGKRGASQGFVKNSDFSSPYNPTAPIIVILQDAGLQPPPPPLPNNHPVVQKAVSYYQKFLPLQKKLIEDFIAKYYS